jgi:ABC-type cobalamin/Fe3+-siderophores transport system ATPase subunit
MGDLLSVQGVWKGRSRGGEWTGVLEDVSFAVGAGEIVAIVGRPLGGKTTLLKIAAGIEQPDRGEVLFGDRRASGVRDRSWARRLGHEIVWIDRRGPRLDVEVSKFVGWPLASRRGRGRRQSGQMARQALNRVGALECVGLHWAELSDWQRVLVGLARAFVDSPRVVIVDDLLDALGNRATEKASDLLRDLMEETQPPCGVVMSVSDDESALFADQVWSLTRKGTLTLRSAPPSDAEVIPFRKHDQSERSPGVGQQ